MIIDFIGLPDFITERLDTTFPNTTLLPSIVFNVLNIKFRIIFFYIVGFIHRKYPGTSMTQIEIFVFETISIYGCTTKAIKFLYISTLAPISRNNTMNWNNPFTPRQKASKLAHVLAINNTLQPAVLLPKSYITLLLLFPEKIANSLTLLASISKRRGLKYTSTLNLGDYKYVYKYLNPTLIYYTRVNLKCDH
ncbi:LOW QUALITY PROTEIN: hypothetical protein V1478_014540 [Vespula squamosa]|uniref:Uncharacterized protein n=1 Tax=Vespula squamosa TaxID=30214 RepID=A0ABD2A899_VESSQ